MIIGIGIDVIEVSRIASAIKRESFLHRVFTEQEIAYCQNRGRGAAASYAARFAGKEAVAKALGTGFSAGGIKEIEIVNNSEGLPQVVLYGGFLRLAKEKGVAEIYVSLTHTKEYAAAVAILWGEKKKNESSQCGGNARL